VFSLKKGYVDTEKPFTYNMSRKPKKKKKMNKKEAFLMEEHERRL